MQDRRSTRENHARYGDSLPRAEIATFYEEITFGMGALDTAARHLAVATRIALARPEGWDIDAGVALDPAPRIVL